jgi:hypothetical protein
MCWAEIQEFKEEVIHEVQNARAMEIYENYIRSGSPMRLQRVSGQLEEIYYSALLCNSISRTCNSRSSSPDKNMISPSIKLTSSLFAEVYFLFIYLYFYINYSCTPCTYYYLHFFV